MTYSKFHFVSSYGLAPHCPSRFQFASSFSGPSAQNEDQVSSESETTLRDDLKDTLEFFEETRMRDLQRGNL